MFKKYDKEIKKILLSKNFDLDWCKILEKHQRMILRIQHERLVHLLVMMFVGIILVISTVATLIIKDQLFLFFMLPLIILFIAYVFHYRFLENTTQNWYKIEEDIVALI